MIERRARAHPCAGTWAANRCPPSVSVATVRSVGYGTLTEPLPIHAPPAVRTRKATSIALQPAVDELNEPENSALPCASNGTSGVSITVGLAEPGPQTSVPLTWLTAPRRPDCIAAGKDQPPDLEHDKAVVEFD